MVELENTFMVSPETVIFEKIQESTIFYGLASYYNNVSYYVVDSKEDLRHIEEGESIVLAKEQWLVVAGRLNVLLIKATGLSLQLSKSKLIIDNAMVLSRLDTVIKVVSKSEVSSLAPMLDQIRYAHLWTPLAWLAKAMESSLVAIERHLVNSWGWAIVIFSIVLKLLLLPVSAMTVRFQRRISRVQAQLIPALAEIKSNYDGEEAHRRLMAAHKVLGVSPFFALKPMLGSLIQVPILIAVFNTLGEMPQLDGQSFLWIENLAYPDAIGYLPFSIPLFGGAISLLPFIMTAVTLYSTVIFQNRYAPVVEVKRQKRNLYFMAVAFFVLFYPFPASMVLYWALANVLQTIQEQVFRI